MNPRGEADRESRGRGLTHRLRRIRVEWFGVHGAPELARQLRLPTWIWLSYESGVPMPRGVVLRLITLTGVRSCWLLDGRGPMYHRRPDPRETLPHDLDEESEPL